MNDLKNNKLYGKGVFKRKDNRKYEGEYRGTSKITSFSECIFRVYLIQG